MQYDADLKSGAKHKPHVVERIIRRQIGYYQQLPTYKLQSSYEGLASAVARRRLLDDYIPFRWIVDLEATRRILEHRKALPHHQKNLGEPK